MKKIIALLTTLILSLNLTACFDATKEEWLSADSLQLEEEKKWGIELQFISSEFASDGEDMLWHFECANGMQYTVYGSRNFFIGGNQTCDYSDDYTLQYVYTNAEEVFRPLNEKGYDVRRCKQEMAGVYYGVEDNFFANIASYEDFDRYFTDAETFIIEVPSSADSFITGRGTPALGLRHDDIILADKFSMTPERYRKKYIDLVQSREIDETLSEEILNTYSEN